MIRYVRSTIVKRMELSKERTRPEQVILSNKVVSVGLTKERFGSLPNIHLEEEPSRQRKELKQRTESRSHHPSWLCLWGTGEGWVGGWSQPGRSVTGNKFRRRVGVVCRGWKDFLGHFKDFGFYSWVKKKRWAWRGEKWSDIQTINFCRINEYVK